MTRRYPAPGGAVVATQVGQGGPEAGGQGGDQVQAEKGRRRRPAGPPQSQRYPPLLLRQHRRQAQPLPESQPPRALSHSEYQWGGDQFGKESVGLGCSGVGLDLALVSTRPSLGGGGGGGGRETGIVHPPVYQCCLCVFCDWC